MKTSRYSDSQMLAILKQAWLYGGSNKALVSQYIAGYNCAVKNQSYF